jgi:hypothetical protein
MSILDGDEYIAKGKLYGECPYCKRQYSNPQSKCPPCNSALLRREALESMPIRREATATAAVDAYKNFEAVLISEGFSSKQFDRLLVAFGRHYFKKQMAAEVNPQDAFRETWASDQSKGMEVLQNVLKRALHAKQNQEFWREIFVSECKEQFYLYTRMPYIVSNFKSDVEDQLQHLEKLSGSTADEKIQSLKGLYFENYKAFLDALTFIVQSSNFLDPAALLKRNYGGIGPESAVVNSWEKYNKYGGRSGWGKGSRG